VESGSAPAGSGGFWPGAEVGHAPGGSPCGELIRLADAHALQSPHVSANTTEGTKVMAEMATPAVGTPVGSPSRFAAESSMPPRINPARQRRGERNDTTVPATGTTERKNPAIIDTAASTPKMTDAIPIGRYLTNPVARGRARGGTPDYAARPMADELTNEPAPAPTPPTGDEPRAGRCAIVGRPNVGKSTLLNALLGQKLAIATSKPGTTRSCILGVYASSNPPTQIAFVDTPGLHRPKSALGKVLLEQAELGLSEADVILFVTEPPMRTRKGAPDEPSMHPGDAAILELVAKAGRPTLLVVNKVDKVKDKRALLPFLAAANASHPFEATIPISAQQGKHLEGLVSEIRERLPEGVLYDDPDYVTDRPERFFVAELIREAVLVQTREEVPHGAAVAIDRFVDDDGRAYIDATIVVEKSSHKGILIGAHGQRIKSIGIEARREIEAFLGRKAVLKLWVKVVEGWTNLPDQARRLAAEASSS
jgi:GTPase